MTFVETPVFISRRYQRPFYYFIYVEKYLIWAVVE